MKTRRFDGPQRLPGAGFLWVAGLSLLLYWGTVIASATGGTGGLPSGLAFLSAETGEASWYGPQFHGEATASGEIFDMHNLTAAHRTLPLGSYVQVRNLDNGRTVVVKINDRGPYAKGRSIDLSYAAAERLGMVRDGEAPVEITLLERGT
jgi:expansin (peptidoglycan-binding protein)